MLVKLLEGLWTAADQVWNYQYMRDYFEWTKQAACKDAENPNLYGEARADFEVLEAKRACFKCPVIDDCAMHAIIYGEAGTWGGMSENERKKVGKGIRGKLMEIAIREGVFHKDLMANPYTLSDDINDTNEGEEKSAA